MTAKLANMEIFNKYGVILICAFLVATTVIVYWPIFYSDFVNYDDPIYVTENIHVQSGLTSQNIVWAFTSSRAGNWHPLHLAITHAGLPAIRPTSRLAPLHQLTISHSKHTAAVSNFKKNHRLIIAQRFRSRRLCPASVTRAIGGMGQRAQGRTKHHVLASDNVCLHQLRTLPSNYAIFIHPVALCPRTNVQTNAGNFTPHNASHGLLALVSVSTRRIA